GSVATATEDGVDPPRALKYRSTPGDTFAVRVWNPDGSERLAIPGRMGPVACLAFSPNGSLLATAAGGEVQVWDVRAGTQVRVLPIGVTAAHGLVFSPDGHTLVAGLADGTVARWATEGGTRLEPLRGHVSAVPGLAFSPDGHALATASWDG